MDFNRKFATKNKDMTQMKMEDDDLTWQLERRLKKKINYGDELLQQFKEAIQPGNSIDLHVNEILYN